MRVLAIHFAFLFLFHLEMCAMSEQFADLEDWFEKNVKGRHDTATTDILIMLCLLKVKTEIQAKKQIGNNNISNTSEGSLNLFKTNVGNIDINNTNILENYIQLPPVQVPNITVVIVEDELTHVARTAGPNSDITLGKLIRIFRECMNKKLSVLEKSAQ
ncbi:uncharacterized protein LOC108030188 [Drosophila biarmipes]|uniref:uncharacterized protein LOC108030188 n=1 Tax=Drosophila biarmipes TaxID=125945 RepID=UPI0007E888E2|nr:uncharacterized protein LOC108030188 [Drosophila biarmipes]